MINLIELFFSPKQGALLVLRNWKLFSLVVLGFVSAAFFCVQLSTPTHVLTAAYYSRLSGLPYEKQYTCLQSTSVISSARVSDRLFVRTKDRVTYHWDDNKYKPHVPILILKHQSPHLAGLKEKVDKAVQKILSEATLCATRMLKESIVVATDLILKNDSVKSRNQNRFAEELFHNRVFLAELEDQGEIGKFIVGDPFMERPRKLVSLLLSLFAGFAAAFLVIIVVDQRRHGKINT